MDFGTFGTFGTDPVNSYSNPYAFNTIAAYNAVAQHTQAAYQEWLSKLASLKTQKGYLEQLLSKTATTLNALRDRQTRNERALASTPSPRSKRKKIEQNRWRTAKTIRTHENEEKIIMDCLRCCEHNISMLEAIMVPTETCSTAADNNWSTSQSFGETSSSVTAATDATDVDWNGWADEAELSPFHRQTRRPVDSDEIAPETPLDEHGPAVHFAAAKRPPALPPRAKQPVPPPPPNTARSTQSFSALSPTARPFMPGARRGTTHGDECANKLDRLSIEGMLASKRVRRLQSEQGKKRFSDAAIDQLFRSLPESRPVEHSGCSPAPPRRCISCAASPRKTKGVGQASEMSNDPLRRSISL